MKRRRSTAGDGAVIGQEMLADDEGGERDEGQHEGERDDARVEPVVLGPFLDEVLQRAQPDPHEADAEPVDVLPLRLGGKTVVLEQLRIFVHEARHHEEAE